MDADHPISLLMVTNTLARGGAEAMAVRLARSLDRDRVRPVICCLKRPGPLADGLADNDIPVHAGLLKHKFDFFVVGRLTRLIRQYAPACVMAVGNGGDRMFWSTLAARQTDAPMIVWAHIFPRAGYPTFERLNRRLYGRVDRFVVLGARHRQALVDLERIPADRIEVIRNGIDVSEIHRPGRRPWARGQLGITDDNIVAVGIIANLRPDKRHDLFIAAADRVHTQRPDTRFVIIGDGPRRNDVRRLVDAADPDGRYLQVLGERDDIPALLQGLDIVCLTSGWQECLSIAMLEAMAAGKPFVAPDIGSLDEALVDHETGRFFDPPTSDRLADVLTDLIDKPDPRKALGQQARTKVENEFTAKQMARNFERLVRRLMPQREDSHRGS